MTIVINRKRSIKLRGAERVCGRNAMLNHRESVTRRHPKNTKAKSN